MFLILLTGKGVHTDSEPGQSIFEYQLLNAVFLNSSSNHVLLVQSSIFFIEQFHVCLFLLSDNVDPAYWKREHTNRPKPFYLHQAEVVLQIKMEDFWIGYITESSLF